MLCGGSLILNFCGEFEGITTSRNTNLWEEYVYCAFAIIIGD